MIIGANPTLQPPQVSPDGKWIWDGHQWQPLPETTWEPAAEALIPQAVALPAPTKSWVQARPAAIQTQPSIVRKPVANHPAATYSAANYPVVDTPVTPLWLEPARSNRTIYMYAGAAAVLLVMLMIVLSSTNLIQLPWPGGASSSAGPTIPSPAPRTSDYARADRFLNVYFASGLPSVAHTLPDLQSACTGTLSSGCLTELNYAKQLITTLLSTFDHGDVPRCIAVSAKAARLDLQSMADGLDMALNGYQVNIAAVVHKGIDQFASSGRSLNPDAAAIHAQEAQCSTVIPS